MKRCEDSDESVIRARMVGEWRGGTLMWGVELAWVECDGEHRRRVLAATEEESAVCRFCQAVDRGGVSPIHAEDVLQDFREECGLR